MGVTVNMIIVGGVDVMHVCYISVGDEEMLSGVWVVKRDICVGISVNVINVGD